MSFSDKTTFTRIKDSLSAANENWYLYLLVVPVLLAMILFLWYPLLKGIWMSFHTWHIFGAHPWVGFENYVTFLKSDIFVTALIVTLYLALASIPQLLIGMGAALALYHTKRFKDLLGTTFLFPFIIPPLATGTILYFFLSPGFGPLQPALMQLGILSEPIFWRINSTPALTVVVGALIWTYWPFAFIIFLAKRQSIPGELYESAKMYGASRWQMFRYITFPHLRGVVLFVVIFRVVNNITKVEQVFQLTRGGPGFSTSPFSLVLYRMTNKGVDYGQAIAVGVIMLVIGLVLALPVVWYYERTKASANTEVA